MKSLWKGIYWHEGIRIGWLMAWRGSLYWFVSFCLTAVPVGILWLYMGWDEYLLASLVYMISFSIFLFIAGPMASAALLRKDFDGFRIQIKRTPRADLEGDT